MEFHHHLLLVCVIALLQLDFCFGVWSKQNYVRSLSKDEGNEDSPSSSSCDGGRCVPPPTTRHNPNEPCPKFNVKHASIEHYLNPDLFDDHQTLDEIAETLRNDHLVVIRDAFIPEFAEALYCDLDRLNKWALQTDYMEDGFHYSHHNIYDSADFSEMMNSTLAVFEHPDSKKFMTELSGRNCMGETDGSSGSASYYMPGDHSLPHTDHMHQRTVAYVWHLSKNWQPEWGGALFWAPENTQNSFVHASFNTLSLFSVNTGSQHFVTTVSPHAKEKRLSFNGWYHSDWIPTLDDPLEDLLATADQRWDLTNDQANTIVDLVEGKNGQDVLEQERREKLGELVTTILDELWPEASDTINEI